MGVEGGAFADLLDPHVVEADSLDLAESRFGEGG